MIAFGNQYAERLIEHVQGIEPQRRVALYQQHLLEGMIALFGFDRGFDQGPDVVNRALPGRQALGNLVERDRLRGRRDRFGRRKRFARRQDSHQQTQK